MKTINFILIYIFLSGLISAQDTALLSKINYYNQKIEKYLDKQKALQQYYKIDLDGISIFASQADKTNNKPEFFIEWERLDAYKAQINKCLWEDELYIYKQGKFDGIVPCHGIDDKTDVYKYDSVTKQKLKGIKIAIDAGHIAGDFETGKMEMKYISFQKNISAGINDSIRIAEGMLTYATSILLKQKLEAEGATVLLTRKNNGFTAFGKTYDDWLKQDLKHVVDSLFNNDIISHEQKDWYMNSQTNKADIFHSLFKEMELNKRAELINNFHPDITIAIHYNVDETNVDWEKPTEKNYNMAFVAGAFMQNELSTPENRFEFLRMIITDDIEKSIQLSKSVVKNFETVLKVKTANEGDAKYLSENCIKAEHGVYNRNLMLTRYIHGSLIYGETLYQDNINECKLLNAEADKTKNKRVQLVADAYYQGILEYYLSSY